MASKLIGASLRAIKVAEDRLLFKDVCRKIGLDVPASEVVKMCRMPFVWPTHSVIPW